MSSQIKVNHEEQLARVIGDLWDDRITFVKEIIGVTPTDQQAQALKAVDDHDNVSIRSGHGCGKSGCQSWLILHYMSTRFPVKVPCTAPTKHQLYDILWSELAKWHQRMGKSGPGAMFSNQFQWTKERFFRRADSEMAFAVARTATKEKPEGLQGFHSDYILSIVDEASGVPDESYEVLDGAHGMIETKQFIAGNPTRNQGQHFETFGNGRLVEVYNSLTWSCLDSPIAPKQFIDKMRAKYGEDSQMWKIRVLGEHHLGQGDSFIPYALAFDAIGRDIADQKDQPVVFGVDVARYGDDETAIAIRQGDMFYPLIVFSKQSLAYTTRYVAGLARKWKPSVIFVDVNGLGGGVHDELEALGYPVHGVNVSESPSDNARDYHRQRDELWGAMRDWLEMRKGCLHDTDDLDLVGELTTPSFKVMPGSGCIKIESKDDMRKRGKASPNRADACLLTFASPLSDFKQRDWISMYSIGDSGGFTPIDPEAGY